MADCGQRGGKGGGRAAWLESQQGVTRVTSLSTWARTPKGTRPCAGDTLGGPGRQDWDGDHFSGLGRWADTDRAVFTRMNTN